MPAFVAVITFIAFLPGLSGNFVTWDDDQNFIHNFQYRGLGLSNLRWMWSNVLLGHFVPLSWMTLGLDYLVWGMNPAGYHFTTLVLHTVSAVLVYYLARRVFQMAMPASTDRDRQRQSLASAFAALLFAIHPLRVESVSWVTERRYVLSFMFYLASVLLYLRSVDAESDQSRRRRWYWISVGLFVCALLSKGTSVTLPAILLILNVYPLRRLWTSAGNLWDESARRVYLELVPFGFLGAGMSFITVKVLQRMAQLPIDQKIAVSAYSLVFYLWKHFVPASLSPLYAMPARVDSLSARYLLSYAVLIGLCACAWLTRRRWPMVAFAWIAFVIAVFPMLGLVQNGPQIAADRYTYYAAPWLAILVAFLFLNLSFSEGMVFGLAGIVLAVLCVLTWIQTSVWQDSVAVWTRVLDVEPSSPLGQNNMGTQLMAQGKLVPALDHFRKAVEVKPDYAEAHNNIGSILAQQGKFPEAIEEFRLALRGNTRFPLAHQNFGNALLSEGKPAEAIDQYREALAITPEDGATQMYWGNALVTLGNIPEALKHYQMALRFQPDNAEAYVNWGVALYQQGNLPDAIDKFQHAIAIRPDYAQARGYLQQALASLNAQPGASTH